MNDFTAVNSLVKKMQAQKEYILTAGKHAAVVRMTGGKYEYLELQSQTDNGFKKLSTKVLKERFGCKRSHTISGIKYQTTSILVDIESLKSDGGFRKMMGYINTAKDKQVKGKGGHTK